MQVVDIDMSVSLSVGRFGRTDDLTDTPPMTRIHAELGFTQIRDGSDG